MLPFAVFLLFTGISVHAQPDSDLFFSEYVEGYGNNKALEIFNPTNQTIDLSEYQITRYEDGLESVSSNYSTILEGELQPGATFILVNGQQSGTESSPACDPELQKLGNQMDGPYPAPTYMDGNDAIALEKIDGTLVDLIGKIGENPGSGWYNRDSTNYKALNHDSLAWTKNRTMIREPDVHEGIPYNFGTTPDIPRHFNPERQWDTIPPGNWSNLGTHHIWPTGVSKKTTAEIFKMYPNPAPSSNFQIQSAKPISGIEIMTIVGRSIYQKSKARPRRNIRVQLSQNRSGIFLVKLRFTDNSQRVSKILLHGNL